MHYHAQLICVFLVKMGFHRIGQAGLELRTSSDSSALASQSAEITGMSHQAWPNLLKFSSKFTKVILVNLNLLKIIQLYK